MCVGTVAELVEAWDDDGVRVGRMADGCVLPLLYVPEARAGDRLLLHLGIPVEVLDHGGTP
jgi:hypothetical protein